MMKRAISLVSLLVAGCAGAPVDVGKLRPPAKWLMSKPCEATALPADDGDPVARAAHEVEQRRCIARNADKVRGLQAYARTVASK